MPQAVVTETDIPSSWRRSAETILGYGWRKILVIGASDCGKSTYCNFLTATLRTASATVAFVDADVGQKCVGPPATITLAHVENEQGLAFAKPAGLYFVGSVDPIGHFLPMVVGTRKMADAAHTEFVVIDTPGLVEGPGRALNAYQIESLQPDAIVAIQSAGELEPTLRAYAGHRALRLETSRKAQTRSRWTRRRARERAFRAYFAGSHEVVLDLQHLKVQRAQLFNGEPVEDPNFLYSEKTPEGIVAIGRTTAAPKRGRRVLPPDFADNLLCGVLDAHEECCGLAIIARIDFALCQVHLDTPLLRRQIHRLQFGDMYIARDGHELSRTRPLLA